MKLSIALILVMWGGLLFGLIGCHEAWTKRFATVESATNEGMIDKGWMPKFIPQDATDIVVSGDLDSGIALGSFTSRQSDGVKSSCSIASDSLPIPQYALRWLNLEGPTSGGGAAAVRTKGYQVFDCGTESFDVAYLQSRNRFYYWTPSKK